MSDTYSSLSKSAQENGFSNINSYLNSKTKGNTVENKVGVKLLTKTARMPHQANKGDLLDLYVDKLIAEGNVLTVHTGVALELPKGYRAKLYARSSTHKYGFFLVNGVGIIDTGYKGEILGKMFLNYTSKVNMDELHEQIQSKDGLRLLQLEVVKDDDFEIVQVEELGDDNRGGGFGSTGV